MSLYGSFALANHFSELGTPLNDGRGSMSVAQRRAAALANLAGTALTAAQLAVLAANTSSGAELSLLDGSVAGEVVAGKAIIGAATTGAIPFKRKIIADGAALVLTANDSGGLVVMDKTDGSLSTLPEATAAMVGAWYDFFWPVSYASGEQKIITGNAADFIVGTIRMMDTDTLTDPLSVVSFNGTSHIACLIDAVTDGGLLGSMLRLTCISATQWAIEGILHHSGNVSSPVSTT